MKKANDTKLNAREIETPDVWMADIPDAIVQSLLIGQSEQNVETVMLNSHAAATTISDEFCDYVFIRNAIADDTSDKNVYFNTYRKASQYLSDFGFRFDEVIRTWICLKDIDNTYAVFNPQRDAFYDEHKIFDKVVPASTAVGSHRRGYTAPLVIHCIAAKPKSDEVKIQAVSSPLQCSAMDYHVSFSRALELSTPRYRRLFVSGTASIAPDGKTIHLGDMQNQTQRTLEVVKALVESREMTVGDVQRVLSFTKQTSDMEISDGQLGDLFTDSDILNIHADICRSNLLFEMEADVIVLTNGS